MAGEADDRTTVLIARSASLRSGWVVQRGPASAGATGTRVSPRAALLSARPADAPGGAERFDSGISSSTGGSCRLAA
jgi:hypothetical protein